MRCFIAVDLSEELKEKIINLQEQIKDLDIKLVEKENLHFTLKFLGEIDEKAMESVSDRLKGIAASTPAFTVDISGVGVFPNENYIRVVWIGAENEDFIKLHRAVDDAMADIAKREKPSPHLTIARVRSPKNRKEIAGFIANNRNAAIGRMTVDKIRLKKSTLTRNGPVYEDVEVFNLGGEK